MTDALIRPFLTTTFPFLGRGEGTRVKKEESCFRGRAQWPGTALARGPRSGAKSQHRGSYAGF